MTKLAALKEKLFANPEVKAEYDRLEDEYAVIEALIRARSNAKLSQSQLAEMLGTTQSAIARLEGGSISPSLSTLRRYAEATGARLKIDLVPR